MVAEEEVSAAMQFIASRARDNVDRSGSPDAGRKVENILRKLELLDHFLRQVHGRAAFHFIVDSAAVDGHEHPDSAPGRRTGVVATVADVYQGIELRRAAGLYRDTRL